MFKNASIGRYSIFVHVSTYPNVIEGTQP